MSGPLAGVKIVEFAGIGPAPFCGMLLADLGAEITRIDRLGTPSSSGIKPTADVLNRGRRSISMNLKSSDAREVALQLIEPADLLIEGFRPGVMERLGLGPDVCLARNPRLIYGRMTGWGQTGSMRERVGHDINYIALSGALDLIGRKGERPMFPLNLLGDMGGGGLLLAFGLLCGLTEARTSGRGQVVDAAMLEGAATQLSGVLSLRASGLWPSERGANAIDSGSHFYEVYETSDGRYVAVGAFEPQFYSTLRATIGLEDAKWSRQMDPAAWPELKAELAEIFKTRSRDEWAELFEGLDACFSPVLSVDEAANHPHNKEREVFTIVDGVLQVSPVPRFSRTPGSITTPPPNPGQHSRAILEDAGFDQSNIASLIQSGVIGQF
jgi:alpha-methylacyl-CoA racemase